MLSLSRQMSTHDGGPFLELYSLRRLCSHYLAKICCSEAKGKDMQDVCQR